MSICSDPGFADEDNVCPFLMKEIMEKGGNSMLAPQVRVAPSSLVVMSLLASRSNVESENNNSIKCKPQSHKIYVYIMHGCISCILTFVIVSVNVSLGKYDC